MFSESAAILAMLMTPGSGYVAVNRALAAAGSAGMSLPELLAMPRHQLMEALPVGHDGVAQSILSCQTPVQERAATLIDRVTQAGAQTISAIDGDYPPALRLHLKSAAPPLLCVLGDPALLMGSNVAIVGARKISKQGSRLATQCAALFAELGVTVVSGGAAGADSVAHGAALEASGTTVVVLPQGLLTFKGSGELFQATNDGSAAVVSEFAPDTGWQTHAAVTRNATISALSSMACVFEPQKTGGSIRTARCALEQGKRVLVCARDGRGGSPQACAGLIRDGAMDLLDDGRFNAERIHALWESKPGPPQPEPELF